MQIDTQLAVGLLAFAFGGLIVLHDEGYLARLRAVIVRCIRSLARPRFDSRLSAPPDASCNRFDASWRTATLDERDRVR